MNKLNLPKLWSHQQEALKVAGSYFALFFDAGTGKTRTTIELIEKACNKGFDKKKYLILAPLGVCRNWEKQLKQYFPFPYQTFLVAGQTKNKKIKTIAEFKQFQDKVKHGFLICNIESLRSVDYLKLLEELNMKFVIVDEWHNLKTPDSKQTKGFLLLHKQWRPEYFYPLSATPSPQGEIDLWSLFYAFGETKDLFFIWRKKHFDDKNESKRGTKYYWPKYVITEEAREKFQKILRRISMTASKDEVLDLPPLIRTEIFAQMGPEQKRHYETMKEFLFAIDQEGNELNAKNLLVRTLRLQQILAGFLGDVPIKDNYRLEALKDAIEKTKREQFVIWTIFSETYGQISRLLDDLGINHGFLTGEQSAEERADYIHAFEVGSLRALIGHPRAGGVGIDLIAASYSIHYTRSFSIVDDIQARARNYRGGSEKHQVITQIDIITPNTIDEQIVEALKEKKSVHDFILGLKQGRNYDCAA